MRNRTLRFKALYNNQLHEVIRLDLSSDLVTIPTKKFPFSEEVLPENIIEYINKSDVNGNDIYEGDYDEDGNIVVWCDRCMAWQFGQLDVPTKDLVIPCHACDGNFFFDEHINEFEIVSNVNK